VLAFSAWSDFCRAELVRDGASRRSCQWLRYVRILWSALDLSRNPYSVFRYQFHLGLHFLPVAAAASANERSGYSNVIAEVLPKLLNEISIGQLFNAAARLSRYRDLTASSARRCPKARQANLPLVSKLAGVFRV
jgi:hypothetical protein